MREAASIIKESLSMLDITTQYGFTPNRAGFISCPFHGDKTPSLKLYKDIGKGWHCFGCGKGGSVVDFVIELFGLTFQQAIMRIDADFALNLPLQKSLSMRDKQVLRQQERAIHEATERKNMICECIKAYCDKLDREWNRLYWNRRDNAPQNTSGGWNPLFVEALQKMSYQNYLIDTANTVLEKIEQYKVVRN